MLLGQRRRRISGGGALIATALALLAGPASAAGAGPPAIGEVWAHSISTSTARLQAQINPNGLNSTYHVDYIAKVAYDANVAGGKDGFSGAARAPFATDASIGSGTGFVTILQLLSNLPSDTAYRYRVVVKNSIGTTTSATFSFATFPQVGGSDGCANALARQQTGAVGLLDCRGYEMVSPVDKNGGQVDPPETLAGGGVLQAAADGQSVTYASSASFAGGAGAATASQYLATRTSSGWSTQNITPSLYSGSYGTETEGTPYRLFSGDLARALLLNGKRCRGEGTSCAVPNPPLAGTDAPAGYQNFYLLAGGALTALLGGANAGSLALEPKDFELSLAGTAPDLSHPVLSTCAALTANATEVPLGEGCDPAQQNLYEWSAGSGLALVNLKPGDTIGTPGATLAAQGGAVSTDGGRVYWSDLGTGNLYLRASGQTVQVDALAGGGGRFEGASSDGSTAFYAKAGHLYRYDALSQTSTDLTPSGEVIGVLGTSEDGSYVYYLTTSGLFLRHGAAVSKVASSADSSNYPSTIGTARVSPDGTRLVFVSTDPLTGYDNTDLASGQPDAQVYLYDAAAASHLICVSCNPTNGRPVGPSTIPGAIGNGQGPSALRVYKPRALTAGGSRIYFESQDILWPTDTNPDFDVYQWEASGVGTCARPVGCVSLVSSGRSTADAAFVDASADGNDVFFLTDRSLASADPGGVDLYDARVGGGFPVPSPPIACEGDACQPLPSPPVDPTLTTLLSGPGNPAVRYPGVKCRKGQVKRKGECVKKAKKHRAKKKAAKRHGRSAR
jgi:hypothetical protein